MIRTYYIENANHQIIEYFFTLRDAKKYFLKHSQSIKIVALKGQYYGEGFHQYYLYGKNGKFKRVKA